MSTINGYRSFCCALIFTLILGYGNVLFAQRVIYHEDFSDGLPQDWIQSITQSNDSIWHLACEGFGGLKPLQGDSFLTIYNRLPQQNVRIETSIINYSNLNSALLTYYCIQPAYASGDFDTLKLYYRIPNSMTWFLLLVEDKPIEEWSYREHSLLGVNDGALEFAFEYCYGGGKGIAVDLITIRDADKCVAPTAVHAMNVIDTMAEIYSSSASYYANYDLKVASKPLPDPSLTGDVLNDKITDNPYLLQGLVPDKDYTLYLRGYCDSSDVSPWSSGHTFRTACAPLQLPYYTSLSGIDIDQSAMPTCWEVPARTTTNKVDFKRLTSARSDKSYALYVPTLPSNSTPETFVLPKFAMNDLSSYTIQFTAYAPALDSCVIEVGIMSDGRNNSSFETLDTLYFEATNVWQTVSYVTRPFYSQHYRLALRTLANSYSGSFYMGNIQVNSANTIPSVTSLRVEHYESDSAHICWDSIIGGVTYRLLVCDRVTNPNTPEGEYTEVAGLLYPEYTLALLNAPNHSYLYVRAERGNEVGLWSSPLDIKSRCGIEALPYKLILNKNRLGRLPDCWHFDGVENGEVVVVHQPLLGGNELAINLYYPNESSSANSGSRYLMLSMPQVTAALDSLMLHFKAINLTKGSKIGIGIRPNLTDSGNFILLRELTITSGTMHHFSFTDCGVESGYITFMVDDEQLLGGYELWLDSVSVDVCIPCPNLLSLQGEAVNDSVIALSWRGQGNTVSTWQLLVSEKPIDVWALNPELFTTVLLDTLIQDTLLVIDGLLSNLPYHCYIRSYCGDGVYGNWFEEPLVVRSNCSAKTIPFYESFEGSETLLEAVPNCWTYYDNQGYVVLSKVSNTKAYRGVHALQLTIPKGESRLLQLPTLDINELSGLTLELMAQCAKGKVIVEVGIEQLVNLLPTFIPLSHDSILVANSWKALQTSFPQGEVSVNTLFLRCINRDTLNSETLYIDHLLIDSAGFTPLPKGFDFVYAYQDSISLQWDTDSEITSWQVAYMPWGEDMSSAMVVNANSAAATIHGLNSGTTYAFYLRALSTSNGVGSAWVGPLQVATQQAAAAIPIYDDFEGDNSGWFFNHMREKYAFELTLGDAWHGESYLTLNNNSVAPDMIESVEGRTVFATRYIHFPAGNYTISFYWRYNGAPSSSYARFYLVEGPNWYDEKGVLMDGRLGYLSLRSRAIFGRFDRFFGESEWCRQEYNFTIPEQSDYMFAIQCGAINKDGYGVPFGFDSLTVEPAQGIEIRDTICQGYSYEAYGFTITREGNKTPGTYYYMRRDSITNDLWLLTLEVLENDEQLYYDTICSNDANYLYGIPLDRAGTYRVHFSNTQGCDSVVQLYLETKALAYNSDTLGVCSSALPYIRDGVTYWEPLVINDNLQAENWCDSIVTIDFRVWPEYEVEHELTISTNELPYSYLDTLFMEDTPLGTTHYQYHGWTEQGCDSIVNMRLIVNLPTAANIVTERELQIYPNPVRVGEGVSIELPVDYVTAEEIQIELLHVNGQQLYCRSGQGDRVWLEGIHNSGLYVVRVILSEHVVFYGKLIVY